MDISIWQSEVDRWIKKYGIKYFDEMTNTLLLTEEVGELARIIAREYGQQSWKNEEDKNKSREKIKEEIADIFFVLTCLANQMDIDLTEVLRQTIIKKTNRDKDRHFKNDKLK